MESSQSKIAEFAKNKWHVRILACGIALIVLLVAGMCISIHMRANMQRKYSSAALQIQAQAYQELYNMFEGLSSAAESGAGIPSSTITELKNQYEIVTVLNATLNSGFGTKYCVLTPEQTEKLDTAFSEFDEAYRLGNATALAQADMFACLNELQPQIKSFFGIEEEEVVPEIVAP